MESDKKYVCEHCNSSFDRSYNLKRHVETIHNRYLETEDSVIDDGEGNSNSSPLSDSNSNDSNSNDTVTSEDKTEDNASEDETENSASEDETEDSASSDESMKSDDSDEEWNVYAKHFEYLVMSCYTEAHNQLTSLEGEPMDEATMKASKKLFRKKLEHYLIIVQGLKQDNTYNYLFSKIVKYRKRNVNLHTAISMAIKSSTAIIDEDFEKVIKCILDDSASNDEESETYLT